MRSRSPLEVATLVLACLSILLPFALTGCAKQDAANLGPDRRAAEEPAPSSNAESEPEAPTYRAWKVQINDDDSFAKDGITYSIALNLTATNPTADPAGTYEGEATARTESTGEYRGQQLSASAIAKSSRLEFELSDPSGGGALADLGTGELPALSGTGAIAMQASGSGTYGPAGGSFGNNSSQQLKVSTDGGDVTLEVDIDGHTYTFQGTLTGEQ